MGLAVRNNIFEMTCKRFQNWFAKQRRLPPFNEAVVDAYFCVGTSSAIGMLSESIIYNTCMIKRIPLPSPQSQFLSLCGGYKPLLESCLVGGSFVITSNVILMRVCNASISYVAKNIRGKEDVHTSVVAGFGYGVVLSLANGMRGPSVLSVGALCALFNGGMFKVINYPSPLCVAILFLKYKQAKRSNFLSYLILRFGHLHPK
ncbi:putative mitochondrial import inner membrane translocase subunit TIM22 [Helianthus anomalus]